MICLAAMLAASVQLSAQTAEEIVERMSAEMDKGETLGTYFVFAFKIPLLGTVESEVSARGDRMRIIISGMGKGGDICWKDGQTEWNYDSEKNRITITNQQPSTSSSTDAGNGLDQLGGLGEGYDVSIDKETADAWYITCKKSRTNTNKDDPRRMDLVISKNTYLPISIKSKLSGFTCTISHVRIGVSEDEVTFDPADFPDVPVVDER